MDNATDFWGEAASGTACAITLGSGSTTCNGDGDGQVGPGGGGANYEYNELLFFWKHLGNASLIEKQLSGYNPSGNATTRTGAIDDNLPSTRVSNSCLNFQYRSIGDTTSWFSMQSHIYIFGALSAGACENAAITAEEAWNIDKKIDDGKPHQGKALSLKNAIRPNCIVASNDAYDLDNGAIGCAIIYKSF
jgi:hypothetical protein